MLSHYMTMNLPLLTLFKSTHCDTICHQIPVSLVFFLHLPLNLLPTKNHLFLSHKIFPDYSTGKSTFYVANITISCSLHILHSICLICVDICLMLISPQNIHTISRISLSSFYLSSNLLALLSAIYY